MRRTRAINLTLITAIVALFAVPLALRLNANGRPGGESYIGADSAARDAVADVDPHYRPWFSPLFEPSSGEVESGIFALQAAAGAGAFGYVVGRMSGRRRGGRPGGVRAAELTATPSDALAAGPTPAPRDET